MEPYRRDVPELSQPINLVVEGEIPASVQGWYFRNGPGKFSVGDTRVAHPFDGDGAICKIHLTAPKSATFMNQYVKTEEYAPAREFHKLARLIAETAASRQMARGSFGTNIEGGILANVFDVLPKNAANISVLWLSGRLFALFEGGQPYELDPNTLQTMNYSTLDGILKIGAPFSVSGLISGLAEQALSSLRFLRQRQPRSVRLGGDAFGSHYKRDSARQRVVCMSYQVETSVACVGGLHTDMQFYEFDDTSRLMKLLTVKNVRFPGYAFVHDFAITEDYIVVMLNPLKLHLGNYVLGKLSPIHSLEYDASKRMQVYVIPRRLEATVDSAAHIAEAIFGWPCEAEQPGSVVPNTGVQVFSLRPHFAQHIANAWTTDCTDGKTLHVQYAGYPEMPDFMSWCGPGQRFENIDPDSQPPSRLMHAAFRLAEHQLCGQAAHKPRHAGSSWTMSSAFNIRETMNVKQGLFDMGIQLRSKTGTLNDLARLENDPGTLKELPPSFLFSNAGMTRAVCSRVLEFPQVNPLFCGKESRYIFGASSLHTFKNRPQQAIGVYDCLTGRCNVWTRGWKYYVGEPEMVPSRPQDRRDGTPLELDGWILSICYDAERHVSELIILDAAKITQGPVATITLPFVIPHGLHGTFVHEQQILMHV